MSDAQQRYTEAVRLIEAAGNYRSAARVVAYAAGFLEVAHEAHASAEAGMAKAREQLATAGLTAEDAMHVEAPHLDYHVSAEARVAHRKAETEKRREAGREAARKAIGVRT